MAGCELDRGNARARWSTRRSAPPARGVRGREPAAPGRDGRRLRPRRPPRGRLRSPRYLARLPASGRRHAGSPPRRAARLGRAESAAGDAVTRRRASGSCCARDEFVAARGFRSARAAASCGAAAVGRLVPGRSAHIPAGWAAARRSRRGPGDRRGEIGWPHERRDVARHRRGDHRRQGRALRPAAAAGRRGAPRQGEPPSRGGLGRAGRRGGDRRRHRGRRRAARRAPTARSSPAASITRASRCSPGTRRPASRSARSSSGRTSAPRRSSTSSPTRRTRSRSSAGCRSTPTSPPPSSPGCCATTTT